MTVLIAYMTVALIWSTTPLAIKWSSEGFGFIFALSSRFSLALVLGLLIIYLCKIAMPWHKDARTVYLIAGTTLFGAMLSVYWGAQYINSGLVAVIFGLTPVFTGIFSHYIIGSSTLSKQRISGTIFAFVGLSIVFSFSFQSAHVSYLGIIGVLIGAALHSLGTVLLKNKGEGIHPLALTIGSLIISSPMILFFLLQYSASPLNMEVEAKAVYSVLYLGIIGTILGATLFFYTLKHISPATMSLLTLVTPVIAILVGILFNNEIAEPTTWVGTSLVLLGLSIYHWETIVKNYHNKKINLEKI